MAVVLNARGTSVPYFKIGKSGVTLYQGDTDPTISGYSVRTNDIWFDTDARNLKFRQDNSTWSEMSQVDNMSELHDVDLTGIADGHFLRYNGLSENWETHEVAGGIANDWGSITENGITIDGYTGDVWQLETQTNTLSHTGPVTITGPLNVDIIHASNLYTDADARSAISASGSLSYDSSTGVISFTDTDYSYATKVGYNLADQTDASSIVLDPGNASTPATFRGDVINDNGTVIVDVSSTSTTFTGGLMGNTYGDVYNPTGANKILESGTGNLDSSLTVDSANATTLNAGTTNISGIATFTGGSVDFTGTQTLGNWNGAVYDRTGGTLIVEDDAATGPIVHADLDGDVTGNVEVTTTFVLPKGTTAEHPANPVEGQMWFNTTTKKFEGYDGTSWIVFSPEDWGSI